MLKSRWFHTLSASLFIPGFLLLAAGAVAAVILLFTVLCFGTVPPSFLTDVVRLILLGVLCVAPAAFADAELSTIEE